MGAAFLVPASVALLIGAYPPERRMQIVAQWGGIGALAVATGPSLGAALVSAGGWRWAFFVNVPVGLFVLIAGRRVLTESPRDPKSRTPDYLGVVLMSLSLAALVLAVSEGSTWGWTDGRILGALAVALVGGAVFVHRTLHHDDPVIDPTLFHSRSFVIANAATVVYAAGFFAMLLGNILFLTSVWDYSIMTAGLAVTPGPVVVALVAGTAGKLAARIGFRPVLLFGAACFALGLSSYVLLVEGTPDYVGTWLPGTLLVGLGVGFTFPVLERRGGVVAPTGALRGGQRGEPDRPPDRRCARHRHPGGAHRIAAPPGGSARRLPPAVGVRRRHVRRLGRDRVVHPEARTGPGGRRRPSGRRAARRRGRRPPPRRRRGLRGRADRTFATAHESAIWRVTNC